MSSEEALLVGDSRMTAGKDAVGAIPDLDFNTENVQPIERFAAWEKILAPMACILPDPTHELEEFDARVIGYDMGELSASKSIVPPHILISHAKNRAAGKSLPLLVNLYLEGGYASHDGSSEVKAGPGDIVLMDPGTAFSIRVEASSILSFAVPRQRIYGSETVNRWSPGARTLPGDTARGAILGQHLRDIWWHIASGSGLDIDVMKRMLFGSISAAFVAVDRAYGGGADDARQEMQHAIRSHIDRHLGEPPTVARLCHQFNCSRSKLYRLFTPFGGIANYIRRARLNRCLEELVGAHGEPQNIADLGYRWGFADHSHFCRLFHETFGATPTDAARIGQLLYKARQPATFPKTSAGIPDLVCFRD